MIKLNKQQKMIASFMAIILLTFALAIFVYVTRPITGKWLNVKVTEWGGSGIIYRNMRFPVSEGYKFSIDGVGDGYTFTESKVSDNFLTIALPNGVTTSTALEPKASGETIVLNANAGEVQTRTQTMDAGNSFYFRYQNN
jgi:hypothetical protein